MGILEWSATIFSLIYLYFAVKNKPVCFIFGIIGSAIWALSSFSVGLKFDTALQLFYIFISVIGIYRWQRGGSNKSEKPISEYSLALHFIIVCFGILASTFLIYLSKFVDFINLPILDATTTVFLIIGTILLIERKLSSWIYLVIADIAYIYIYGVSGLWLFVAVMIFYIVFGINGFINWKNIKKTQYQHDLVKK